MTDMTDSKGPVGVDRVLAVLLELGNHPAGVSLDDLTNTVASSKPTVHRALAALRRAGLATQQGRGLYSLGDGFVRMALRYQASRPEGESVEPALQQLVQKYGETAHYAVLEGTEVVYRAKVDPSEGGVKLTSVVGGRNPAYRTAVGKLLLSLAVDDIDDLRGLIGDGPLTTRTPNSIATLDALWEDIARSKKRGYAIDDQENEVGINCVAVPVRWSRGGRVVGAISVSALAFRTPLTKLTDDIESIQRIVDQATLADAD